MDFMFEDDVDEVGSDVEAYCPKCKADTTHVVISKYEDEIRRVQCNPCGDVHSFRKPRGETEDDVPEPVAAKKRALLKKPGWEDFFAKRHSHDPKPYEFREHYRENAIVNHPKFGVGFVSEIVSDSKVEITFKDARRILVHNRRDIPGLPLAAEGDGVPTPAKGAKPAKAEKAPKAEKPPKVEKPPKAEKPAPEAKVTAPVPTLKVVPKPPAAVEKPAHKPAHKNEEAKPAKAEKAPAKVEAKGKPPVKPAAKPAKAAPARGVKTAAKSAAKKPAPKPKKKAGKKR
jgi:hypothetical protein